MHTTYFLLYIIASLQIGQATAPFGVIMPLFRRTPCNASETDCDWEIARQYANNYSRNTIVMVNASVPNLNQSFALLENATVVGYIAAESNKATYIRLQIDNALSYYPGLQGFALADYDPNLTPTLYDYCLLYTSPSPRDS